MSWRIITEADLAAVLSEEELRLYRERATTADGTDPIAALITNAVHEARDRIRANPDNTLADGVTVPVGMVRRVLILIRQSVLTVCKVPVGEDRQKEAEAAEAYFRDVADGKVSVPQPETATADETPAVRPRPRYNAPPSRPAL